MTEAKKYKYKFSKKHLIILILIAVFIVCCILNSNKATKDQAKILGEAEYVSSEIVISEDVFSDSRMAIEKTRDNELSHYKEILENKNVDEQYKTEIRDSYIQLLKSIELEAICEEQIKNKIKQECMVTINPPQVTVTVNAKELQAVDVNRIKEIIVTQTNSSSEHIKISLTD